MGPLGDSIEDAVKHTGVPCRRSEQGFLISGLSIIVRAKSTGQLTLQFKGTMDLVFKNDDAFRLDFEGLHAHDTGSFFGMMEPSGWVTVRLSSACVSFINQIPHRSAAAFGLCARASPQYDGLRYPKRTENAVGARREYIREPWHVSQYWYVPVTQPQRPVVVKRSLSYRIDASDAPQCSFLMFAQMQPSPIPAGAMVDYERELAEPSGITTAHPPPATLDGILISRECMLVIEAKNLTALQ